MDASLSSLVTEKTNIENLINEYNEAVKRACNDTFPIQRGSGHSSSQTSVPWWTAELTVLRKKLTHYAGYIKGQRIMKKSGTEGKRNT